MRDERFKDAVARYRHSAELIRILDELFTSEPLDVWKERLARHRLIWAPVLTLAEAVQDPTAEAYGSFPTVQHPTEGSFRTVAPPLQMSGHAMPGTRPPRRSAPTPRPCCGRPGFRKTRSRCWRRCEDAAHRGHSRGMLSQARPSWAGTTIRSGKASAIAARCAMWRRTRPGS